MTLRMKGRIKVGFWLPFTARQECDASSFICRAQVPRHVPILTVTDCYDDARGTIDGRLFGAVRMFHFDDQNIVRAAAARAATEGIFAPIGLLPSPACIWHAESDSEIIVDLALAPERLSLHLTIDDTGALQSVSLQRWGNAGANTFGYIPFWGETSWRRSDSATSSCRDGSAWDGGTEPSDSDRSLRRRSSVQCRTTRFDLTTA
jgi:hypothetical protein